MLQIHDIKEVRDIFHNISARAPEHSKKCCEIRALEFLVNKRYDILAEA
jgi:hypothetical protein